MVVAGELYPYSIHSKFGVSTTSVVDGSAPRLAFTMQESTGILEYGSFFWLLFASHP